MKCDLVGLIRFLKGEPVKFKDYLQVILGGSGKFVVWKKDRQREAAGLYPTSTTPPEFSKSPSGGFFNLAING